MDTETQAVHELLEITFQTTKYTYRFLSALFKHGSHGAAALAGLIQSALSGRNKGGLTTMKEILKNPNGITSFTLDRRDYGAFVKQATAMRVRYTGIAAETDPDRYTIITGSDQAALVNQIISVNNLNGVMLGTLEQAAPPITTAPPEQAQAFAAAPVPPQHEPKQTAGETDGAANQTEPPENPQAAAESTDFFSSFTEPEQTEPERSMPAPQEAAQDESSENFFAAFSGESEPETVYHQEPEIISIAEAEIKEQPEEVIQAMREAGYFRQAEPEPAHAAPDPINPAQRSESLSGNELPNTNGKAGLPTANNRISVRSRVAEIKKSGKPKDAPITAKVRELVQDKKGVAL